MKFSEKVGETAKGKQQISVGEGLFTVARFAPVGSLPALWRASVFRHDRGDKIWY